MDDKTQRASADAQHLENGNGTMGGNREVDNTSYPPAARTRGGKAKHHCGRFWWLYLIIVIIIVLVIVLPVIYVAIPKKAQSLINSSTLDVNEQDVTNPSPSGFHLKLVTDAKSGSSFHPTIGAFRGGLSLPSQPPFTYIDVPAVKAEASTPIVVDEDVKIANQDQFNAYNRLVIGAETFQVELSGMTKVHQSGLPSMNVNYTKIVTMKGLNKLSGLNISVFKVLPNGTSDGYINGAGQVYVPNPSVMTLDLGNVTMNLAVGNQTIGTSVLQNMVLKPGDNYVNMTAKVEQLAVFSLVTTQYKSGILPLDISGNSSVYNGQHLQYYEAAIQSNTVRVNLNVTAALSP